jgi:hypothetical protein
MLGQNAFYHNIIRKYIVAFGSLFNDVHVIRSNEAGETIKDIKVPITFASKDKTRYQINSIHSRQNEHANIAAILPRMSYILNNNIEFDTTRVINPLHARQAILNAEDFSVDEILVGKPFNFTFQLSIWTKYLDDMFQIFEQVVSFFNPDYTVTIKEIPVLDVETNIPIVFQGCAPNFETEFDDSSWRSLRFDIDFVLKGWIYPPIRNSEVIENIKFSFYSDIDDDKKISILKNEYDSENNLLYHAIVDNTNPYFANVDNNETIKDISQKTLNVYRSESEPILADGEDLAYWIDTLNKQRYIIEKSGTTQKKTLLGE